MSANALAAARARHQASGELHAMLAPAAFADEMVLTKCADLFTVLRATGPDPECLDEAELETITAQFAAGFSALPDCRIYQYLFHTLNPAFGPPPRDALSARREHWLSTRGLFSIEQYLALLVPVAGSPPRGLGAFSARRQLVVQLAALHEAKTKLRSAVMTAERDLRGVLRLEALDRRQTLEFLRRLVNFDPVLQRVRYEPCADQLDRQMALSSVERRDAHLLVGDRKVRILSLGAMPAATFPNQLRGLLSVPANMLVTTEWKQEPNSAAIKAIDARRRHFHSGKSSWRSYIFNSRPQPHEVLLDNSKASLVDELNDARTEIERHQNHFGRFALTVAVWDADERTLAPATAAAIEVFDSQGARIVDETVNLIPAWLGMVPGNIGVSGRSMWLLDRNYADLGLLHTPAAGSPRNEHFSSRSLAVLETREHTPYHLSPHYQDVGHLAMFGATGSGKTFALNTLVSAYQQYGPRTYIFDLGGGYKSLANYYGASYLKPGDPGAPRINPFALDGTPENVDFLFAFVRCLIERNGRPMKAEERTDLNRVVAGLYTCAPQDRTLASVFRTAGPSYRAALEEWTGNGRLGRFFDSTVDELALDRFQIFDFDAMEGSDALEPLLFYILHRASAVISDPALAPVPKLFVLDEAWRFFRTQATREYIVEALKTWRKRNGAIWVATQSGADLTRDEMTPAILENSFCRIFLAHPGFDREAYQRVFGFNRKCGELIAGLAPKRELLFTRPGEAKVLRLDPDPETLRLFSPTQQEKGELKR